MSSSQQNTQFEIEVEAPKEPAPMTGGYKAKSEAELLLEEIDSMDPFADKRPTEEISSPAPTDERPAPKSFKPINDEELENQFPEKDQMWWVVRKVGTAMQMKDRETGKMKEVFAAWKPRLAQMDCCGTGVNGKNNAFRIAIKNAKEVIDSKNPAMRNETISFDVIGPLKETQLPSHIDEKLRAKSITRNLAESNIHAIVSTRVFNRNPDSEKFMEPQITMVARGKSGMTENDFASRFPGGRIPMEEIREFTKNAAKKMLPPPPDENSDPEYVALYNQVMSSAPKDLNTLVKSMDDTLDVHMVD